MYYPDPDFMLFSSAAANDVAGILAALAAGADPNSGQGVIPVLHLATLYSNETAVGTLLDAGADANALYDGQRDGLRFYPVTPLHYAAMTLDAGIADLLLAAGADATRTVRDEKGNMYDAIGLARVFGSGAGRNFDRFFGVLKRAARR